MFHPTLGGILPAHRGAAPRHLTTIGANTSDLSVPLAEGPVSPLADPPDRSTIDYGPST